MAIRRGAQLWVGRDDAPGAPHVPLTVEHAGDDFLHLRGDVRELVTAMRVRVMSPQPTTCLLYRASVVDVRDDDSIGVFLDEQLGAVQRREWVRVGARLPVLATVSRPSSGGSRWEVVDTATVDVSAGGIRLDVAPGSLPDGLPLSIDVTLPGGTVHAVATPVPAGPGRGGTAVRFVTMGAHDRERLVAAAGDRGRDARSMLAG